ncbi:type II secretion system protein [Candidatus Saccharibacteria bacterium]|nr:type II secretion system protein [Candidatus Saccharibacteria bacterium]
MTRDNTTSKSGFTIIEVVLVLAIAGLIFLMVFIALPALQRNQRNTQRRDDYSMLSTAVTNYMSNNGGRLSKIYNGLEGRRLDPTRWINSEGTDPNGNMYEIGAFSYDGWESKGSWYPGDTVGAQAAYCQDETVTDITQCPEDKKIEAKEGDPGSQVFIIVGANCNETDANGDARPKKDRGTNAFVVYGYMEGGANYCQASGSIGDAD